MRLCKGLNAPNRIRRQCIYFKDLYEKLDGIITSAEQNVIIVLLEVTLTSRLIQVWTAWVVHQQKKNRLRFSKKFIRSGFHRYLESKKSEREAVHLEANQTSDSKKTRFLAD